MAPKKTTAVETPAPAKVPQTIWEKLAAPFPAKDIEWRIAQSGLKDGRPWGKVLAYITARAIMDRLDTVLGPENWSHEVYPFTIGDVHGFKCRLMIQGDDHTIVHEDVCDISDIEPAKGAVSGSLKRAAVHVGIGRYLYNLDGGWADFSEDGEHSAKIDGKYFRWNPPTLPAWALPVQTDGKALASPVVPSQPPVATKTAPAPVAAPVVPAKPAPVVTPPPVPKPEPVTAPVTPVDAALGDLVPKLNKDAMILALGKLGLTRANIETLVQAKFDDWRDGHKKIMLRIHNLMTAQKKSLSDVCAEYGCTLQPDGTIKEG